VRERVRERGIERERENTFGFGGFLAIAGVQASGFFVIVDCTKNRAPELLPVGGSCVSASKWRRNLLCH
jgi:hypothetical protein